MTDNDTVRDLEWVIMTPDEAAPRKGESGLITDGNGVRRRDFLETRERLASVESSVDRNGEVIERVDDKLDVIDEDLARVEEDTLDKEYFENHYKSTIETNDDVTTLLIWGGGVALALVGAATTVAVATGLI